MKPNRIFKVKIRFKESGKETFIIMGDSYKSFEEHFLDVVNSFTKRWIYDDSPEGKGRCLGREMEIQFLELYESRGKFVSYGGLKYADVSVYDTEVEEHNSNSHDSYCPYLRHITFKQLDDATLRRLLNHCQVIQEVQVENRIG